jgi:AcrR family transcriptional regulator
MGIAERKEREKEDVRRKILEAAHTLFETRGYEHVTMRAVADAIEYSPTTIYHHFASKEDPTRPLAWPTPTTIASCS